MATPAESRVLAWAEAAGKLLPPGALWHLRANGVLQSLLRGMADEFARIEERSLGLYAEMNVESITELIGEWEESWGIPGECENLSTTLIQRRYALAGKIASTGGQSAEYFIQVAARMGWEITIEEHVPPAPGPLTEWGAGSGLTGAGWIYTWIVHAPAFLVDYFTAGESLAGEPLTTTEGLAALLECTLEAIAPAHAVLLFEYDLPTPPGWYPWEILYPRATVLSFNAPAPVRTHG